MPEDGEPALSGSTEELARSFDEYEALGADHLILALDPATEESLDRVAAVQRLRHSSLGMLTPVEFEKRHAEAPDLPRSQKPGP